MALLRYLKSLIRTFRNFRVEMRASRALGRSERLLQQGKVPDAFESARDGLVLLRTSGMDRRGTSGGVLLMLTIRAEQLGQKVGLAGASNLDIADSVEILRGIPPNPKSQLAEIRKEWLPYFESRLGQFSNKDE